jgi:triosephosphate isomerase (TIM)
MKYIVANWKANKTLTEVASWADAASSSLMQRSALQKAITLNQVTLVVCPSFPFLIPLAGMLDAAFFAVGSQSISSVENGAATGEVTGAMLAGVATYSIVGHSERRSQFAEDDASMAKRIAHANTHQILPILCVRDTNDTIYTDAAIVAFEPVSAIGSGKNMAAAEVIQIKSELSISAEMPFLYGGSVTRDNASEYLQMEGIDGLLIGSASMDPLHFLDIAEKAI